jgi:two-component system sensor kinase FixL
MDMQSRLAPFMPHGMCLLWRPDLMGLHVISDGLIALAYFTIPFAILRFVQGRRDLEPKHRALALLFAAFIAFCGLTHIASIIVLWNPIYVWEGWLKAITALVSLVTAGLLTTLVPLALKLPSAESMRREIAAHRKTMAELDAARAALAVRVENTEGALRVAEQHRHQSAALLSTVIEAMPGLIYAKDRSGRMLLANEATLGLLGKPWSRVEGRRDDEILSDKRQAAMVMAQDRQVMDSGQVQEIEEIIHHPGKGPRVYLSSKVPFGHAGDPINGIVGVAVDITERKQLARDLLQVSRRSAMGQMATAIAHELNQPLAAITMFLDGGMTLLRAEQEGPLVRSLAAAKEQSLRAGDIIRRLRAFVSGGDDITRPENLASLVDDACGLALLGARENGVVTEITHKAPDLEVLVDRVQIEQVIVNLVRNGLDAMGEGRGGSLRIATGLGPEGMAMLSVSDTGPGISPEVADRLFEAFVSTKGVQGMGVGLSICRTIIERHGGRIWLDPNTEAGATFRVTIPARLRAEAA